MLPAATELLHLDAHRTYANLATVDSSLLSIFRVSPGSSGRKTP